MGQVMAIISGKGGTGKTTLCAGLGACLAARGQRVLCIDADIGLRNLDIALGVSDMLVLPFTEICRGRYPLTDATKHPHIEGLYLLTAPIRELPEDVSFSEFEALLNKARDLFDWILIDAPAGLGKGFKLATQFAEQLLVVSTADPASLRDAARTVDLLELRRPIQTRLIVNRVVPKLFSRMHLTIDDMMDEVGLPLLGIVPEDPNVVLSATENTALILKSDKGASIACMHIASRLCGERAPLMRLR